MLFNVFSSFALTMMATPIVSCSPLNGQIQARADAQAMTPAAAFAVFQTSAENLAHIASNIQNSAAKSEFNAATTKAEISAMMTPLEQAAKALQASDGGPQVLGGVLGGLLDCLGGLLGCNKDECKSKRKRGIVESRAVTAEEATAFVSKINGNVARLRADIDNVGEMTPGRRTEFWWRIFDDCHDIDDFLRRGHYFYRRDAPAEKGGKGPAEKGGCGEKDEKDEKGDKGGCGHKDDDGKKGEKDGCGEKGEEGGCGEQDRKKAAAARKDGGVGGAVGCVLCALLGPVTKLVGAVPATL